MPDQLTEVLQQQLRDVHLPDAVGWWPMAFGWWLAAGLFVITVAATALYFMRQSQQKRYRKAAQAELQSCYAIWQKDGNTSAYLHSASAILKRAVLCGDKHSIAASQSGQRWVDTLQRCAKQPLSEAAQTALAGAYYQANPVADIESIHPQLSVWIKSHRPNLLADCGKDGEVKHA